MAALKRGAYRNGTRKCHCACESELPRRNQVLDTLSITRWTAGWTLQSHCFRHAIHLLAPAHVPAGRLHLLVFLESGGVAPCTNRISFRQVVLHNPHSPLKHQSISSSYQDCGLLLPELFGLPLRTARL